MNDSLCLAVFMLLAATVLPLRAEEYVEPPVTAADREHWSFRPLERPIVPAVGDTAGARDAIDLFLLARLEKKGLRQQPPANCTTLIRRATLDLTGLPPAPEEVDAFLAEESPDAYERLVDRLLSSPASGEHFAQSWLDLARWAETDGFEHDEMRPEAWNYRDWVIEAFNADMPYDQFVALQLAGDELRPGDAAAQIATGFCLAGPDMRDINLKAERRHTVMNDLTSTVGSVFLGLQFGCAQCHDHKNDPLSQADFYRLRAIFDPAVNFSGYVLQESKSKSDPSRIYVRGDFRRPGAEVAPDFPRIVNVWNDKVEPPEADAKSSGRRRQLARWLTRDDHPLTSRVMVNRLWLQHFGRGLSDTPSDFGVGGEEPVHGELLDWLATELVDHSWSMKYVRRRLVTSAVYRQASRPDDEERWRQAKAGDPQNILWSRYPRRRVTGEMLRDMMLAVSESLNRERHGESVRPPLPKEVVQTLLSPSHWKVSKNAADHDRRSVYIFARRNLRFPIFEAFDRPAATASCSRRNSSTIAPQSLVLLNSEFSLDAARRLAECVSDDSRGEQIRQVFRRTLGRLPNMEEVAEIDIFFNAGDEQHKLIDFCLAMLNFSEFLYLE